MFVDLNGDDVRSMNCDFKNNYELYSCFIFIFVIGEFVLLVVIFGFIDIFFIDFVVFVNCVE